MEGRQVSVVDIRCGKFTSRDDLTLKLVSQFPELGIVSSDICKLGLSKHDLSREPMVGKFLVSYSVV